MHVKNSKCRKIQNDVKHFFRKMWRITTFLCNSIRPVSNLSQMRYVEREICCKSAKMSGAREENYEHDRGMISTCIMMYQQHPDSLP